MHGKGANCGTDQTIIDTAGFSVPHGTNQSIVASVLAFYLVRHLSYLAFLPDFCAEWSRWLFFLSPFLNDFSSSNFWRFCSISRDSDALAVLRMAESPYLKPTLFLLQKMRRSAILFSFSCVRPVDAPGLWGEGLSIFAIAPWSSFWRHLCILPRVEYSSQNLWFEQFLAMNSSTPFEGFETAYAFLKYPDPFP